MRISEAYSLSVGILEKNGIENASFETDCLIESVFSVDRIVRIKDPSFNVDFDELKKQLERRISGVPLQYIIGKWDFYGFSYKVGEGVLIPRPETELLVENAAMLLKKNDSPVIFDLCAGTGCIGLTLARIIPQSTVYLFEKSESAFEYLLENSADINNAIPVKADIFTNDCQKYKKPDLIISNPPYVKTDEIRFLQAEVLNEPEMALDGGNDGLDFYRLISRKWLPLLNGNGVAAFECGEDQAQSVIEIISEHVKKSYSVKDYSGIDRIVIGEK